MLVVASSFIIFFAARFLHITLMAKDVRALATEIGAIAGAIWSVYGGLLHLVTW